MQSKRRRRKIIILILLILAALLLAVLYINFRATKNLGFDIAIDQSEIFEPPTYLYSFSGPVEDSLQRPIGDLVLSDKVLVADARRGVIDVFDLDGNRTGQWGAEEVDTPLYIAQNPVSDEIWVTDRRLRTIHRFSESGEYKGEFDPNLPEDQLPTLESQGYQWAPVNIAFAPDGSLYVLEILKGHRLLVFAPDGTFKRSIGTAGFVKAASDNPEVFQFPNSVKVYNDEVWVADSNNRRIQIFSLEGDFLRLIPTEGLPRGIDFLEPFSFDETQTTRFAVVDSLSHDVTLWRIDGNTGERLARFGKNGVMDGEFSYPNDISVADNGNLYVVDTSNGRVQVWGWLTEVEPIPLPRSAAQWGWCLSPLLLLLLPLFFRRRKILATRDFVETIYSTGEADKLPHRQRKWYLLPEDWELLRDLEQNGVRVGELFEAIEHSESDANTIQEKLEIDHDSAIVLSVAQRMWLFCTNDVDLRRFARLLEIEVANDQEFLEKYASGSKSGEREAGNDAD